MAKVIEQIKEKIKSKPVEFTPELEASIRADERVSLAKSFNFQSLFNETESSTNFALYIGIANVVLSFILMIMFLWKK